MNIVAVIRMISTTATTLTFVEPSPLALRKVCEISAPKILACRSDSTCGAMTLLCASPFDAPSSTRNRARKTGD
jgi:hypothetical protein